MTVTPALAMNAESMLLREEAEQRVIEAKIRERAAIMEAAPSETSSSAAAKEAPGSDHSSIASGFGSSLEQDERIASLRARSSSISDHDNAESIPEELLRSSFAMTPEERRQLEDEMRAQHSHPLSLQLEAEAEERRMLNEQEYIRNNPTMHSVEARARRNSSRRSRGEPRRDWNQIVEAFERGGHGEVNSLDDLVVLEAAMILSMEEESRRRAAARNERNGDNNNGSRNVSSGDGSGSFDANQHANEGFPLVRSILSGRQSASRGSEDGYAHAQIQNLAESMASRRRSRNSFLRAAAHGEGTANAAAMDTAGMVMRGMTEDDQMAMAIAASLQDQQQPQQEQQEGDNSDGGGESICENGNDNEGNADTQDGAEEDGNANPPSEVAEDATPDNDESSDADGPPPAETDNASVSDSAAADDRSNGGLSSAGDPFDEENHGDSRG